MMKEIEKLTDTIKELQTIFDFSTQRMIISKDLKESVFYDMLKTYAGDEIKFVKCKKYNEKKMFLWILDHGDDRIYQPFVRQEIYTKMFEDVKLRLNIVNDVEVQMHEFPGILIYDNVQHCLIYNSKRDSINISFEIINLNGTSSSHYVIYVDFKCDDLNAPKFCKSFASLLL